MRATTISALGLAVAAVALTGCGSDGTSTASKDYCRELKADKSYFLSLAGSEPGLTDIEETFRRVHTLSAAAPAEVASDWEVVDGAVTTMEDVLRQAGLTPDQFAAIQKGENHDGVDLDKLAALAPQLQELGGKTMDTAADHITRNAKAACGIDLKG